MYLVGCRDVRASWNVLYESMDLENGLDCLIEVVISYPPTATRWMVNRTARISISSQRNEFDPLFFKPVNLQTVPIMYRAQREDILSRRGVEGILQLLTLSVAIGFILTGLFYIKENANAIPFVSLVMLSVQAVGYGIPLVMGAEALLEKTESYEKSSVLEKSQMVRVIDYTVKILVLVSFSLTLRLYQKVWRARIQLQTRAPNEPTRVPSDRWVLIVTGLVHVLGFVCVLVVHNLQQWLAEFEEYVGLVQDFFLLPQFSYERLVEVLDFGKFRVLPRRTVAYEQLPPVVAEAEMTSGGNGDVGTRKEVEVE
ncbi:unnamed protein product [Lactuca virosa]|uniref:RING-type E3 ubiquitin transferase n=1 Tax=Lactuca virosa TaxID=75947 RepID=A0AAU9NWX3_9ASTR|nr:unnamed protein product [Lactuca virosa]